MNKNHMSQFEKMDGFVVFNSERNLDGRKYGLYEVTISPATPKQKSEFKAKVIK